MKSAILTDMENHNKKQLYCWFGKIFCGPMEDQSTYNLSFS